MIIQYLGTAAAEGIPALFCECDTCKRARALGGKNIRSRSQAIIDGAVLIDYPADTYMHFLRWNFPLHRIRTCLITHSHQDHLYPIEIEMRKPGFAHLNDESPLTFYSAKSGFDKLQSVIDTYSIPDSRVKAVEIKPYEPFGVQGYNVMPVRAEHGTDSTPVVYAISKDGKSLFYAHDTSELCNEAMECLKSLNKPFDLVSLDCTQANDAVVEYSGHMSLNKCVSFRDRLICEGTATADTVFVLNHFSHNGKDSLYDDFSLIAERLGFVTSYDGMIIEF